MGRLQPFAFEFILDLFVDDIVNVKLTTKLDKNFQPTKKFRYRKEIKKKIPYKITGLYNSPVRSHKALTAVG